MAKVDMNAYSEREVTILHAMGRFIKRRRPSVSVRLLEVELGWSQKVVMFVLNSLKDKGCVELDSDECSWQFTGTGADVAKELKKRLQ
jgi:predicted transcriptional regulator